MQTAVRLLQPLGGWGGERGGGLGGLAVQACGGLQDQQDQHIACKACFQMQEHDAQLLQLQECSLNIELLNHSWWRELHSMVLSIFEAGNMHCWLPEANPLVLVAYKDILIRRVWVTDMLYLHHIATGFLHHHGNRNASMNITPSCSPDSTPPPNPPPLTPSPAWDATT